MDQRIQIIIEADIDEESLVEKSKDNLPITPEDVLQAIILRDSDNIDGFELTTSLPGFNCAFDFFLCNGKIMSKKLI
ncbi:hypothetical protein IMSAGC015_00642 [Lachnospiraceae bacterium]|jgi:hypothetical protein|nr:hypothetical protein IMSAGC015_00642 [Lachnospiraceae bacterium]